MCVLFLATITPPPVAAEEGAGLTVDAPGWQVIQTARNASLSPQLFMAPGDVNGDGFDDLLVWRGFDGYTHGYALFNGTRSGIDPHAPWLPHTYGGLPDGLSDTSTAAAADRRPTGVDASADGRHDVAGWYRAGSTCNEIPDGQVPPLCGAAMQDDGVLAFGHPQLALTTRDMSRLPNPPYPRPGPTSIYLIGPTRPDGRPSVLGEAVNGRTSQTGTSATTEFSLFPTNATGGLQAPSTWSAADVGTAPSPERVPRFLAAPDFDGDRLADIVTWVPRHAEGFETHQGRITVYNGSVSGPAASEPYAFWFNATDVAVGDFDGDGHPDLAGVVGVRRGSGSDNSSGLAIEIRYWTPAGTPFEAREFVALRSPSLDRADGPVVLQAGDIDGDGRSDLALASYDSVSSTEGRIRVDVFLEYGCSRNGERLCSGSSSAEPTLTREVGVNGSHASPAGGGLRLNLQSDYDGDGRRDIIIGFYGTDGAAGAAGSGFVAVLTAAQALRDHYRIWIDTDPGGIVLPAYRNYTIHVAGWRTVADTSTLRISLTNFTRSLYVDISQSGSAATSSSPEDLAIDGPSSIMHGDGFDGAYWFVSVPVRFNGSLPHDRLFGLEARWVGGNPEERAFNPRAALFAPSLRIEGPLHSESEGRVLADGGWVRGGAQVNFTGLRLAFAALPTVPVPTAGSTWAVDLDGTTVAAPEMGGPFAASVVAGAATRRGAEVAFRIEGPLAPLLAAPYRFTFNIDADVPSFGAPFPSEAEWITSSPAILAAQVFDNASGVDPARIEYSTEYDGAPFVRWYRAAAEPGQSAGEVVARALVSLPEGDLSNILWRAWDRVGNGPGESRIFHLRVDTADVTFHDPYPGPSDWVSDSNVTPAIWIRTGPSELNRSSIEYRVSNAGLFGFGPWTPWCPPVPGVPPGGLVWGGCLETVRYNRDTGEIEESYGRRFSVRDFVYAEGDRNWVQWRASNNASSKVFVSDPFQIRFDSRPPVIESVLPDGSRLLPLSPVTLSVSAHEGSPQGVAQRGLNLSAGAAAYRVQGPHDATFGPWRPLTLLASTPDRWGAQWETAVADLERGPSVIEVSVSEEDGATVTARTTVRVNQAPAVAIESDPAGFVVLVNGSIRIMASAHDDGASQIHYEWSLCGEGQGPLSSNASLTISQEGPAGLATDAERDIVLCLVVRDDMDGENFTNITVLVRSQESLVPTGGPPLEGPPPLPPAAPSTIPAGADLLALALMMAALAAGTLFALARRRARRPDGGRGPPP
ncbi:MAG TPA: VCBS repeat-containing protein [Candidatus Thermoplasmatota archaeon]